ncbi:MAG: tetratricopeptide repeat protein [Flavobacteriales bacterium]|jgi:tetratricopeptide (TPR) repeat protein|uniref:tetratricopeptide repeat protein n=1 Tax=Candidatus Ulvibacter alkanivorans TaxID=2267620 RepID=UPI000DF2C0B8|nr:tetratricopeptide repeat protein [Candidatus Ulvibacter alkanivorans]MCH2490591.1 tetratricopeptide repeat protein [Flavobacteriales bacterium]
MRILLLVLLFPLCTIAQSDFEKAEDYFKKEQFSKAKPLFERYLDNHPNDKKTLEYLGDIAGYAEDWDTAIDYYETLVDSEENNANYHFKYGGSLGMKALSISRIRAATYIGDIKEHFEKAAKLDPHHIEVRWALVEFYIQLPGIIGGSERKATKYANELLRISPVDGYLANGYIAEYSNRPEDAERFYKKAIEIGDSPHTYEKLAEHYEKNNKPKEAIETATRSLKKHKRNQLNYQIGKIAAQYNLDAELGIDCLQAYIKNHSAKDGVPKDWAYYRLAQIYKNIGKKQTALLWINKALEDRPDFKEARQEKEQILAL